MRRWEGSRGTVVALRPLGDPLPLGLFGLAVATLTLAGQQLGWIGIGESTEVGLAILAFAVPLQLIAAAFAYLARDGVAATGLGVNAGSWFVIGLITLVSAPGTTSNVLGIFLLAVAMQLTAPAFASLRSKSVIGLVLTLTALRFTTTAIYELSDASTWEDISGIVGLVLFAIAFCAGLALTLTEPRRVQVDEPGVRPQL